MALEKVHVLVFSYRLCGVRPCTTDNTLSLGKEDENFGWAAAKFFNTMRQKII